MPSTPPPAPFPLRTGDDYDPWTGAIRCRAELVAARPGMRDHRCFNRTTNLTALCWRHTPNETVR